MRAPTMCGLATTSPVLTKSAEPPLLAYRRPGHGISINSVHLADELVNIGFPIAEVATLDKVLELPCPPATGGVGELKRPQAVVRLLEVGAGGEDLVDEIFDREDVVLAKCLLDDLIVRERDTLLIDFAVATLVDELTDRFQVGLAASLSNFVFF